MAARPASLIAFVPLGMAVLTSCAKHECDTPPSPAPTSAIPVERYSLLTPGNYWIYERAQLDTSGAEMAVLPDLDSVFVAGDSTINGNTYAVLRHPTSASTVTQLQSLQRDSADRVVDQRGHVVFLVSSSDQVIQHETVPMIWEIDWIAVGAADDVTVPLGTFSTREVRSSVTATGSVPPPGHATRYYRALDHGLVKSAVFYASGAGIESRLVREHIQ